MLVIANVFVLSLYTSGWSFSRTRIFAGQDKKRLVTKNNVIKNEPIEIADIKIKDKKIALGEGFEGDEEWLKNIDFTVKNRWDKAITYLVLNIDFPETKATGSIMMHSLYLGRRSDVKATLANPPLRLEPNESMKVSLAPHYEEIKEFIETRQPPVGNIHEIKVWLDQVTFEDETTYSGGNLFKRNPDSDSPRKWIPVAAGQTPPRD